MDANETKRLLALPKSWLIGVHIIVPILLLVFLTDVFLLDQALLPYMGVDAALLPIYLLLFELPHIVASLFSFADREYLRYYKWHVFVVVPLILLSIVALWQINFMVAFGIYIIATMYHVIRQQTGIAHLFGVPKSLTHSVWTWSIITTTSLGFAQTTIFANYALLQPTLSLLVFLGLLVILITGVKLMNEATNRQAQYFLAATLSIFIAAYIFLSFWYIFIAYFVIRFVHEVTAFMCYVVHDTNRSVAASGNFLYEVFKRVPLPVLILTPVTAIVLAFFIRGVFSSTNYELLAIVLLGFIHYYLESVMWKRGSLHRQYLKVA